jgi:hypothetical protein
MTYERMKTGMFRVCVVLTILVEWLLLEDVHYRRFEESMIWAPLVIWSIYFVGFWIIKGFLGKK